MTPEYRCFPRSPETDQGTSTTREQLRAGQAVYVLALGRWRPSVVVRVNRATAWCRTTVNRDGRTILRREQFRWIMLEPG